MSVETLVQEDQVNEAVVENERLLRPDELQEKRPNAPALALVALREVRSVRASAPGLAAPAVPSGPVAPGCCPSYDLL